MRLVVRHRVKRSAREHIDPSSSARVRVKRARPPQQKVHVPDYTPCCIPVESPLACRQVRSCATCLGGSSLGGFKGGICGLVLLECVDGTEADRRVEVGVVGRIFGGGRVEGVVG